jgi:hypothetical protein
MTIKPPAKIFPVLEKLKEGYKTWQQILPHISKSQRQTIGVKIDRLLLETLDLCFRALYKSGMIKIELATEAIIQNDLAKFFLMIAWECKIIDDKKYIKISEILVDSGKMLFGWKEYLQNKNPLEKKLFEENA